MSKHNCFKRQNWHILAHYVARFFDQVQILYAHGWCTVLHEHLAKYNWFLCMVDMSISVFCGVPNYTPWIFIVVVVFAFFESVSSDIGWLYNVALTFDEILIVILSARDWHMMFYEHLIKRNHYISAHNCQKMLH